MELGKTKRSKLIRSFLLNSIKAGNQQIIHDALEIFDVSRQTIHNHLSALVKMGYLEAEGNTRARKYRLGSIRSHEAEFSLEGLRESDVYFRDFGFVFKDLPANIEDICHYGFTEILNNAIDHSGGASVRVNVERSIEDVVIRITDNGEGIFNHIARLMNLSDPRESILELSKGKLTTDPENHSGQGVFFTSRTFDDFHISSSDLVFSHRSYVKNDFLWHNDEERVGTDVFMQIKINSSQTLSDVFSVFSGDEDEDYAFNTTVVPVRLALYEGERLISRSQAKRILNRVEKFKTVMLDFEGVDFIGQAFADEVFRVFARRNPQILLLHTHLTDEVERMIKTAKNNPD